MQLRELLPLQLRELVIQWSWFRRLPKSLGRLNHLKKLCLIDSSLEYLPEEFCLLQSLEHLHLERCKCLESLPTHFGDLMNLRHLNLSDCKKLRMLCASFKQLKHPRISQFTLSCEKLALASEDLENITKLKGFERFRLQGIARVASPYHKSGFFESAESARYQQLEGITSQHWAADQTGDATNRESVDDKLANVSWKLVLFD
ncbi:hypothetical protein KI387_043293 [Taxus chinensis]|uniref:Disease resistance R13L4/SHOC-2-like LRR domain-containing protein n=1 Tax=Taxus chinensis TaxID=29808 RepID=A0AA38BZ48_TAXCH|nr:hypothetical protein KI387_043293 [Taxus chinensis]